MKLANMLHRKGGQNGVRVFALISRGHEDVVDVAQQCTSRAARDRAEAANAALAAGRGDFGDAIEAERAWYETELAAEEALVSASRRAAELRRALGQSGAEDVR